MKFGKRFAAGYLLLGGLIAFSVTGCGGGGSHLAPAPVIGQPASSHNQGGVEGKNFAWGEDEQCPPGFHQETTVNPDGTISRSCVPNVGGMSVKAQGVNGPFGDPTLGDDGSVNGYDNWPQPGAGQEATLLNLIISPADLDKALDAALPSVGDPSLQ